MDECAICFDSALDDGPVLPCACNVAYCFQCWDRALAQSFNNCGEARCPTCRARISVDWHVDENGRGRMIFSRAPEGSSEARGVLVERLAEKASPHAARLLQEFGASHPELCAIAREPFTALAPKSEEELAAALRELGGALEGSLDNIGLITRLVTAAGNPRRLATFWASRVDGPSGHGPRCVCSGALIRMDGRERLRVYLRELDSRLAADAARLDVIIDAMVAARATAFVCDLCDERVMIDSNVWTCGNGSRAQERHRHEQGRAP